MPERKSQITSLTGYVQKVIEIKKLNEATGNNAELIFSGQPVDQPLLPGLARLDLRIEHES